MRRYLISQNVNNSWWPLTKWESQLTLCSGHYPFNVLDTYKMSVISFVIIVVTGVNLRYCGGVDLLVNEVMLRVEDYARQLETANALNTQLQVLIEITRHVGSTHGPGICTKVSIIMPRNVR